MRVFRLALLCCLTACSEGEANLYRSSNQPRVIGDGMAVTVTNVASETEALPFADQYCTSRGRVAKFNRMLSYHRISSSSATFDCISSAAQPPHR